MSPQKKITIFLSLTVVFSSLSYLPIIRAGTIGVQSGLFVFTMMWSPGLAAILTQLIATRSLRGLGWRFGSARWLGIAYILPTVFEKWLVRIPAVVLDAGFKGVSFISL